MSLIEHPVPLLEGPVPRPVGRILELGPAWIDRFMTKRLSDPVPGFHPCDFRHVYHALLGLAQWPRSSEAAFCEWGCGLGVVSCMAAGLGWRAYGVDVEPELVAMSERLAAQFELPAWFFCGSFIPHGSEIGDQLIGDVNWLDLSTRPVYDQMGLDVDEFSVIFAYPWPGEEDVIFNLFDQHAARGTLLLSYHGAEVICLHEAA